MMSNAATRSPRLPPRWFVHTAWRVHRALYRLSGGRFLWTTSNKRGWGALSLTTIGRKSGQERSVIIGYLEEGPNLITIAMNGWDEGHPSWWLNLEAQPDAVKQGLIRAEVLGMALLKQQFLSGDWATIVHGWRYPPPQIGRPSSERPGQLRTRALCRGLDPNRSRPS